MASGKYINYWDLRPTTKMTNANVASVVSMGKSRVLSSVPVFVNSQRQAEGSLTALRVKVGLNGQVPPM